MLSSIFSSYGDRSFEDKAPYNSSAAFMLHPFVIDSTGNLVVSNIGSKANKVIDFVNGISGDKVDKTTAKEGTVSGKEVFLRRRILFMFNR